MKKIIFLSLSALCFATGFTCSKNTPESSTEAEKPATDTVQEQMAAPVDATGQAVESTATPVPTP